MTDKMEARRGRADWKTRSYLIAGLGAAVLIRLVCVWLGAPSLLGRRVEISTPVNSIRRLAEGYWLKHNGRSQYAGSAYHGSPLLLAVLGPLTSSRKGGHPAPELSLSLLCITADFVAALLLMGIGRCLDSSRSKQFSFLGLNKLILLADAAKLRVGELAAMFYLWNPFTVVSCIGGSTSPIENAMVILSLHGGITGNVPLAAFAWVMATHCSLYPVILCIPIGLSLAVGIDHPPRKLFKKAISSLEAYAKEGSAPPKKEAALVVDEGLPEDVSFTFQAGKLRDLIVWSVLWWAYVLILCQTSIGRTEGLWRMLSETYGFILKVEDLSPNLGLFWYFFTEVFDFFRPFFLLVFHINVLFMILPLTIRLYNRPLFLAFIFLSLSALLKSYPSVGDAALYMGLMPLFINELSGMRFTFFLLYGYVGVALLSPAMYNLWIWRGTGNANFYFAMALVYACIQLVLIVECVSTVLIFDRNLRKLKEGDTLKVS